MKNKRLEWTWVDAVFSGIRVRNRMVGELHDTIGHTSTSIIVGIDDIHE